MPWAYRSPLTFPARYPIAIREAVANLQTPILLHSGEASVVSADAENFRYYRWCLRQNPDVDRTLSSYFSLYQLRTSLDREKSLGPASSIRLLYLTASPHKFTELAELNPDLLALIDSA